MSRHHDREQTQADLVREVAVEGRAARFDAKGMRNRHFICGRCGNVDDMEWYDVPSPATCSLGMWVLRECELVFRGCARSAVRGKVPVEFCASVDTGPMAPARSARPAAIARMGEPGRVCIPRQYDS